MPRLPGRVAAVLALCALLAGCSPSATRVPAPNVSATPSVPAIDPTSEELIGAALTSGSITYEQSLLYRALALYGSSELPAQFRSKVPDLDAAGQLFGEIDAKASTLSASVLAQLAPYRARPADPASIFNSPQASSGAVAWTGANADVPLVAAGTTTTWKSLPVAGANARVWVKDSATADADLAKHAADVATVWTEFKGIFTYPIPDTPNLPSAAVNSDDAIDIYFANVGTLDPRQAECAQNPALPQCGHVRSGGGYAQRAEPSEGETASGYLVIDAASSADNMLDTLAHELAHTAQYAYDQHETPWLYESTATWVAYRVMKKLGKTPEYEYNRLGEFFAGLDLSLTRTSGFNVYGSWLYFLFASMEKGDGVVIDVWKAAGAAGVQGEQAVDKVLPFDKHFVDFAVRNWNQDPVQPQYKNADPTFPDGYWPSPRNAKKTLAGGKEDALNVNLPPLASAYYQYSFTDSARDVTFENSLAGIPNAHVWAIPSLRNVPGKPEDWTDQAKKKYCRDVPEQDLTQVVIVVSNSSMTDKLQVADPPKVVAGAKGCSGWAGTMKGSWAYDTDGGHGTGTSTFSGVWIADESDKSFCQGPSSDCTEYRPTGTISWTWDSHHPGSPVVPPCDQTVSGTVAAGEFKYGDQQVFYVRAADGNKLQYWGAGQSYLPEGTTIDCPSTNNGEAGPPPFFELSEDSSSAHSGGGGETCSIKDWRIDVKGDTITGSCYWYKNDLQWEMFEWTLKRVGK